MAQLLPTPAPATTIAEWLAKISWKQAVVATVVLGLVVYPWPLVRVCLPVVANLRKQKASKCPHRLREIVLTCNEGITLQELRRVRGTKGSKGKPVQYEEEESFTVELFRRGQANSTLFASQPGGLLEEQANSLFAEALLNNLRVSQIEQPGLKMALVKSNKGVLQQFLLKFYKLTDRELHKVGAVASNKLHILRFDERVGTYEQIICDFEEPLLMQE